VLHLLLFLLVANANIGKLTPLAKTTLGESYAAQKRFELAVATLKEAVEQIETRHVPFSFFRSAIMNFQFD
jgi:hypothetical protein